MIENDLRAPNANPENELEQAHTLSENERRRRENIIRFTPFAAGLAWLSSALYTIVLLQTQSVPTLGEILVTLIAGVLLFFARRLARQGKLTWATWLTFGVVVSVFPLSTLFWTGAAPAFALSTAALTMSIVGLLHFSRQGVLRALLFSLVIAGGTLVIDNLVPWARFDITTSIITQVAVFGIIGIATLLFIWQLMAAYQHIQTIRLRLLFFFALIAILSTAAVTATSTLVGVNIGRRQVFNQLQSVAELKADDIQSWLEDLKLNLEVELYRDVNVQDRRALFMAPQDSSDFQAAYNAQRNQFERTLELRPDFEELFLMDQNGRIILSTDDVQEGKIYSTRTFFRRGLEEMYVAPPNYDPALRRTTIVVTHPVYDQNGKLMGVLAGRASMDELSRIMLTRAGLGATGETYLVGQNHAMLTESRFQEDLPYVRTVGANAAIENQVTSFGMYDDYRGVPIVGYYEWIPELEVALLAEQDRSEAFQAISRTLYVDIGVGVLSALVAVIGALVITQRITNPLADLARTATQIAEGDITRTAEVSRQDEIGNLARAFNQMTARLRELIQGLEQRVAERTQDLETRSNQLEAAAQVAREAAAIRDVRGLLRTTVDLISQRFGFYHAGIFLIDEAGEYAVLRAASSEGGRRMTTRGHRLRVGEMGIVGYVASAGKPRVALDTGADATYFDNPDLPHTHSEMALPLRVRGRIIGVLDVQSREQDAFSDEDIAILQTLADQIALALENTRLLEESERALRELQVAHGEQVRSAWAALERARGFEYDRVEVTPTTEGQTYPEIEQVLRSGETLAATKPDNGRSTLVAPLRLRDYVIGTIGLEEQEGAREWTDEEIELVETVSEQVAQALEDARLFEQTQEALRETETLYHFGDVVSREIDIQVIYDSVARYLVEDLGYAENVWIAEVDHDAQILRGRAGAGTNISEDMLLGTTPLSDEHNPAVITVQERKPTIINDPLHDERITGLSERVRALMGKVVEVPIFIGDTVSGVMAVTRATEDPDITQRDVQLLQAVAAQTAIAIQRAQLFQQTQAALADTASLYEASAELNAAGTYDDILTVLMKHTILQDADQNVSLHAFDRPWIGDDIPEWDISLARRSKNESDFLHPRYPLDSLPAFKELLRPDETTVIEDLDNIPGFSEEMRERISRRLRGECAVMTPLVAGGQWIGYIHASYSHGGQFSEDELRRLTNLAGQAALGVQSIQRLEETRTALTETEALYTVGEAISELGSVEQTFQTIADTLVSQLGYASAWLAITDSKTQTLNGVAGTGAGMSEEIITGKEPLDPDLQNPSVQVILEHEPILINDVSQHPRTADLDPNVRAILGRMISVPIMVGDLAWGTIAVNQPATEPELTDRDVELLTAIADQAAVALQNLRLLEETNYRATQLETGAEVSRATSVLLDVDELLPQAVDLIRERLELYYVGIFMLDESERWAVLEAGTGEAGQKMKDAGHKLEVGGHSMVGQCIANSEARVAFDTGEEAMRFDNPVLPETRSEMALPLTSRGKTIGAMSIHSAQTLAFTEEDITVLQTIADQLANAIENARLFSETEETLIETRELYEASQRIGAASSPAEVGQVLMDYAANIELDLARVLLYEHTEETPTHIVLAESWTADGRPIHPYGTRMPLENFALSRFIDAEREAIVQDTQSDRRVDEATELLLEVLQLQSFAIIPLTVGQREIGGILIGRDEPSTYAEKLLGNLRTLASQASITIENLRLLDETQERAQELASLNEVGQVIASILDPEALVREIADITKARFGHDYVGIFMAAGDRLIFEGGSTISDRSQRLERGCMQFDIRRPGIPSDAARTGEPVLVNDVLKDPRYTTVPELSDTRSKLVVPIEIKGRVIGVLDVERNEPSAYAQTDIVLLQSLANQAGVAIENARLFQEAERAAWREHLAREIMSKVQSATDVENILQVAVQELGQALRTPRAVVQLRSDNHQE